MHRRLFCLQDNRKPQVQAHLKLEILNGDYY
jgi:hypothetical protein